MTCAGVDLDDDDDEDGPVHVLPAVDTMEHELTDECWCDPEVSDDEDDGMTIIHNRHADRKLH